MPAFSSMGNYNLTQTQIDLILYALNKVEMSTLEDNERRKIIDTLQGSEPYPYNPEEDPYANYCDI